MEAYRLNDNNSESEPEKYAENRFDIYPRVNPKVNVNAEMEEPMYVKEYVSALIHQIYICSLI